MLFFLNHGILNHFACFDQTATLINTIGFKMEGNKWNNMLLHGIFIDLFAILENPRT